MHGKRFQNILLMIVISLLLLNLGGMLFPVAHAIPKKQYKAVQFVFPPDARETEGSVQQLLNQQSAEGWEYVSEFKYVFIFKR